MAAPLIALVGPTASGKSALALRLARECHGEIVSCDSLQVYRGLDIGSAKATPEERASVPHHLIDVVEPDQPFSAADYARLARRATREIRERGRLPIVAGGTGLYLKALLQGLFEGPSRDTALRARLERLASRFGNPRLHRLLRHLDPLAARRTHANDRVRIVRALEVYWLTGRPITAQQSQTPPPLEGPKLVVGLDPDRARLREAVVLRTRAMLERGLLDEVRGLVARFGEPLPRPLAAIGYRQAIALLRGELEPAAAEQAIVTETMRFAKRQMTWFRHQADVHWFAEAGDAQSLPSWPGSRARPPVRRLDRGPWISRICKFAVVFMLLIDIPRIPPEGLDLDELLDSAALHLESETEFRLTAPVRIACKVDLVDGTTLHVRGRLSGQVATECGRCLENYELPVGNELDLFYLPRVQGRLQEEEEEVELTDRDVVVGYYDGEKLDLGEVLREQIILGLPFKRLCREDCRGRCASCGRNLNEGPCACPPVEEPKDPRLAPLGKLFQKS